MGSAPKCAYCRQQPVEEAWRPFCSKRCQMADLGRWLAEDYRVPGPPADDPPASALPGEPGPLDES
jgi:endogenous inhibitor of DNA gyrase (YacG/DUF329 family)